MDSDRFRWIEMDSGGFRWLMGAAHTLQVLQALHTRGPTAFTSKLRWPVFSQATFVSQGLVGGSRVDSSRPNVEYVEC